MDTEFQEIDTEGTIEDVEVSDELTEPVEQGDVNNSQENSTDDSTPDEFYVGTYKTKDEAQKGINEASTKIKLQGDEIAQLKKQLGQDSAKSPQKLDVKFQEIEENVLDMRAQAHYALGIRYKDYLPHDFEPTSFEHIIANLPPLQAAQLARDLKDVDIKCQHIFSQKAKEAQDFHAQEFEKLKNTDKERLNTKEAVFEAWYNPPKTIDELETLVDTIEANAVQKYLKQQQANKENENQKQKLTSIATAPAKFSAEHIFTQAEIDKMSMKTFAKYEAEIDRQMAKGLIK